MIKAINDKVVVQEIAEKQSEILIKRFVPRVFKAKVLSVGNKCVDLKVDDIVLVDRAGLENAGDYAIAKERDILAVVNND